jgi:hypothetical protein
MISETPVTFATSSSMNGQDSENKFTRWAISTVADLGRSVGLSVDGHHSFRGS